MAQKDRRQNRKRRRRGRHPGLYKALSAGLILAALVAACAIFFRVEEVEVYGNQRYSAQEIIDVAGVKTGDNLFALQAARISRTLQSRLPYVRAVSVRRMLPSGLSITVTESRAAAAIAQDGKWWLMDGDGKLLEQAGAAGSCAIVTGIDPLAPAVGTYLAAGEEESDRVGRLKELLSALEENGLGDRLDRVDLTQDYQVTFSLDGRFTVHLSPALEKGTDYWVRRLAAAVADSRVSANQSYTVEIMDDQRIRFIPD